MVCLGLCATAGLWISSIRSPKTAAGGGYCTKADSTPNRQTACNSLIATRVLHKTGCLQPAGKTATACTFRVTRVVTGVSCPKPMRPYRSRTRFAKSFIPSIKNCDWTEFEAVASVEACLLLVLFLSFRPMILMLMFCTKPSAASPRRMGFIRRWIEFWILPSKW